MKKILRISTKSESVHDKNKTQLYVNYLNFFSLFFIVVLNVRLFDINNKEILPFIKNLFWFH